MVYDPARERVVLFGGRDDSGRRNDTWEWDGSDWTRVATTGPPERCRHAMAYDRARGVITLFGGSISLNDEYYGDTWEWDGTTWMEVFPSQSPAPRERHAMSYDSSRGVVRLFGGEFDGGNPSGETWEWDGLDWRQRIENGPSPRWFTAMIYDPVRDNTLLFGGLDPVGYSGETWEFVSCPHITQQPSDQQVWIGQPVQFSVQVESALDSQSYQWYRDDTALGDGDGVLGSTTATLTIDPVQDSDAGEYSVVVTCECGMARSRSAVLEVEVTGDSNGDGIINHEDYQNLVDCFGGPGEDFPHPGCVRHDFDVNGEIDLFDFGRFQIVFTGP
jgi:hypothetical protein